MYKKVFFGDLEKEVKIKRINVRKFRSISNMDLAVDRDGIICLTGANGVGKSSILDMIAHACAAAGFVHSSEDLRLASENQFYNFTVTLSLEDDFDANDKDQIFRDADERGLQISEWDGIVDVTLKGHMKEGALQPTTEFFFAGLTGEYQTQQFVSIISEQYDKKNQLKVAKIDANRSYTNDHQRQYQVEELRQ